MLCTSINDEIVHGIPSEKRILKPGDIVSIDCGVVLDGYYGDADITVAVDDSVTPELRKLLQVFERPERELTSIMRWRTAESAGAPRPASGKSSQLVKTPG